MPLLNLLDIRIGFGGPLLLDNVNLQIDAGERVCLTGRNGAGKSTLMRLLTGEIEPDSGEILLPRGKSVAYLDQQVPDGITGSVREIIEGPIQPEDTDWERDVRIDRLLEEIELDGEVPFDELSAGLKRRVLLARGLADAPALLLLDEPTNHLDIESIQWLEKFLLGFEGALLFITHDRMFLRRLATRILELDRGTLTSWTCDYDTFLSRREELLEAEEKQRAAFDKKLAREEAWLRQGIKARRTRNEGRVRALQALREERRNRRERLGSADMQAPEATLSGEKVIEVESISFSYANSSEPVIRDFSTLITRGDKIGIIGKNGAGKSTLLRLLLGELEPASGFVKQGTKLEIAYFDQLREHLDPEKTVRQNITEQSDMITVDGKERHVISYLQDFLFTPDRANSPVKSLSGGETNRLLLARLFTRPSNLLVLDEPTNDLDTETLELLEERLSEYKGTVMLVSHDREFLNNVVTSVFVLEGDGFVNECSGGYDDYRRQRGPVAARPDSTPRGNNKANKERGRQQRPRRFTNRERRELETLPNTIEELESRQQELAGQLADPQVYQEKDTAATIQQDLEAVEKDLGKAYARWEELESLREKLEGSPAAES